MVTGSVKNLLMAMIGTAFISLVAGTEAQAVTLTFDELPSQPIDDLSFMGVTFDFKVDGVDSNSARLTGSDLEIPGTAYIQWPAIDGEAAGILTLDFTTPISMLEFGVGLSTFSTLTPGFAVELFDPALTSLGITVVNTSGQVGSLFASAGGLFSYTGVPVKRAVVDFNENFDTFAPDGPRFALDNLTFTNSTPIPEPASITGLLALGAFGAGSLLKRKQKQAPQGSEFN